MTLDDLLAKTPEQFRPLVAQYGPALVAMTADEFCAWLDLLINGKTAQAWKTIVSRLDNASLMAAWESVNEKWADANRDNAAKLKLQRDAVLAVLKVLLAVALAGAGL